MRYAVTDLANIVSNVIEWDGGDGWTPPVDCAVVQSDHAQIGDVYNGAAFSTPG